MPKPHFETFEDEYHDARTAEDRMAAVATLAEICVTRKDVVAVLDYLALVLPKDRAEASAALDRARIAACSS